MGRRGTVLFDRPSAPNPHALVLDTTQRYSIRLRLPSPPESLTSYGVVYSQQP